MKSLTHENGASMEAAIFVSEWRHNHFLDLQSRITLLFLNQKSYYFSPNCSAK